MKLPAMRFLAIPPALCALVGFILTMLCIFAGSRPGYLESHDMVTLNTSMIGFHAFESSSSQSSNSSGGLLGALEAGASKISHGVQSEIENEINKGAHDIASHLNISDFYSWHMLDFCRGFYEPGAEINATNLDPWKNVTSCSNHTAFFAFNATAMLEAGLRSGVNLTSLDWPSGMEDAIDTIVGVVRFMFVLYCLGAGVTGFAMFTGIAAVLTNTKLGAMINAGLAGFAFFVLGLASCLSTYAIDKVVDSVNEVGPDVGIEAIRGNNFVTLTWVTTMMAGLASLGWILDLWVAKRRLARAVRSKLEGES